MKRKPIYVEIPIESDMDKLWKATQTPDLHEKWDLRFSSITYLPKEENRPQEFSYQTKIAPGLQIEGWGKTAGSFHARDGSRTSSLHFGTDQAISIIKEGRGFWKYKPVNGTTISFFTEYNYETNFGWFGKIFDRFMFRPLIGWGTALSFDVLKRWLEKDELPFSQYMRFFSYWLISLLFFFIWTYHGLIPKLIYTHPSEVEMFQNALPISEDQSILAIMILGMIEVMFGTFWLVYQNKRSLFIFQIILFPLLTVAATIAEPENFIHPFTPLTFNLGLIILSMIGLMMCKDVPTAKSCKRKR